MKKGLCMSVLTINLALVMVVPGGCMASGTPGSESDSMTDNPLWEADPGWCCVMEQSDIDEGNWGTGNTFYQVFYRNNAQDDYDDYIFEMTIPWVGIRMQGGNMIHYDHSEDTSAYHLKLSSYAYTPWTQQVPTTSLDVDYILDFDGDSNWEWKFEELIEFHPPGQGTTAWLKMEMQVKVYPVVNGVWIYNNTRVQSMALPFFFDPDVYDNSANDFFSGNIGNWNQISIESSCNAANNKAKAANTLLYPEVALIITPNPQNVNPTTQTFTFLHYQGNEYAHDPSDYDDDDGMEGNNGLVWYIETYDVLNNNFPPNPNNGGMTGIICDGFVA